MAQLLKIESDGPVSVRERGKGGQGLNWSVQPEDFTAAIAMVNTYGGPACWDIRPL